MFGEVLFWLLTAAFGAWLAAVWAVRRVDHEFSDPGGWFVR